MVTLNKPSAGDTDWATEINDNWTALENQLKNAFQGRLQRDSTTQVSVQRYGGDVVEVNGFNVSLGAGGIALTTTDNLINSTGGDAGSAMAASTFYYVYLSNASVSTFPSDLRASTTAPSSYNGVKYLGASGNAANWRFVGWVRMTSSTQFADSETQRLVINYYNRRMLSLEQTPAYSNGNSETTYTTTSTSWVEANSGTNSRVEFISNGEDAASLVANASMNISGVGNRVHIGLGIDSGTSADIDGFHSIDATGAYAKSVTKGVNRLLSEGYHFAALLVRVTAGTGTYTADEVRGGSSADPKVTFIAGFVMG